MEYKFYKLKQFPPHWFTLGLIPLEALEFFDILNRNDISFVVRGGFAIAAITSCKAFQIKDVDLIVLKSDKAKLISLDLINWEAFFNKNSKGKDVYSIFCRKEEDTYLKFDMTFMGRLPKTELIYTGLRIVNAEFLLLDKLEKVIAGNTRGYENWKKAKNLHDCKLLIDWFVSENRFEKCSRYTISQLVKILPIIPGSFSDLSKELNGVLIECGRKS